MMMNEGYNEVRLVYISHGAFGLVRGGFVDLDVLS